MPLKTREELEEIALNVMRYTDPGDAVQLLDSLQVDAVKHCRNLAGSFAIGGFDNAYDAIGAALENREKI